MSARPDLSRHPYADFIHKVQKPARYLGGEYQSIAKDHTTVRTRVCLAFPDIYDIGMSHLGTKILYTLLNRQPDIACERAFAPWVDMEAQLRERGMPLLSLETWQPLREFDVIGCSLQYEMTYTNVLNILDLSGIPLRAVDRDETFPLIIAGGPTATHPEPIAPFVDAILVGDAEEILPRTLRLLADWRDEGVSRCEQLERMAALGGWYCPALYALKEDERSGLQVIDADASEGPVPVTRAFVADINDYPFPSDAPVAAAEAIFDRMSIEIARGCTEGCRFCQAGMIYRPVRERDPEAIVDTLVEAVENGGYDEVALTSLSTADYSCVSPLIKRVTKKLYEKHVSLGVSSLRAYGLAEDLFDEMSRFKTTGLTFAPEAGTQRMRDVVNKNVTEAELQETAHRIFSRGWQRMKLYFMLGLPTEQDEDLVGIVETSARARDIGRQYRKRIDVTASVSSHVPKPHTPFQWAAMDSMPEVRRKQELLRRVAKQYRIGLKVHNEKISFLEGIVARGDRRVADTIELAWSRGCRFDGWDDQLKWDTWLECIADTGLDPQRYLGTLPLDGGLPWDHIDVGLADRFLAKEWKRATKDKLSPPCGKPVGTSVHHTNVRDATGDARKLVCYHCGVACDLTQMRDERIDYLKKLGAEVPAEPLPPEQRRNMKLDRRGNLLPPERPDQGEAFRYRFAFTKLGAIALTSQLDLTRAIPRVFRRAGIPVKYSAGFSPHPLFSWGPALALGVSSVAEAMDVHLLVDADPGELVDRLNAVTDEGMAFLTGARIPDDAGASAKVGKLAEYIVACPAGDSPWTAADVDAAVARTAGTAPITVRIRRKSGEKVVDVRAGIVNVQADVPTDAEQQALGLAADVPVLRWRVNLNEAAHIRPDELTRGVFGLDDRPAGLMMARTGLWGLRKEQVFDLLAPDAQIPLAEHAALPRTTSARLPVVRA